MPSMNSSKEDYFQNFTWEFLLFLAESTQDKQNWCGYTGVHYHNIILDAVRDKAIFMIKEYIEHNKHIPDCESQAFMFYNLSIKRFGIKSISPEDVQMKKDNIPF